MPREVPRDEQKVAMHVRLPASELAIIDRAVSRLKMEVNREYSRSMLVREAVRRFLSETGDP